MEHFKDHTQAKSHMAKRNILSSTTNVSSSASTSSHHIAVPELLNIKDHFITLERHLIRELMASSHSLNTEANRRYETMESMVAETKTETVREIVEAIDSLSNAAATARQLRGVSSSLLDSVRIHFEETKKVLKVITEMQASFTEERELVRKRLADIESKQE